MFLSDFDKPVLLEGGNVFQDTDGIPMEQAAVVLANLRQAMPKPLANKLFATGSAGYKPIAGDMDVMLDAAALIMWSKAKDIKTAKAKLAQAIHNSGIETKMSGVSVHAKVPMGNKFAQVDIMVVEDAATISKFHQHDYKAMGTTYKGSHKHIMLSGIARTIKSNKYPNGLLWSAWQGLYSRGPDDKKDNLITRDPNKVAQILLNPKATIDDLKSPQAIITAIPPGERKNKLAHVMAEFQKEGIPFPQPLSEGLKMGDYGHEKEKARNADNTDYGKIRKNLDAVGARIANTRSGRVDMMGKICRACHKGAYKETSIYDDWDGKLHCSKCGHETNRWVTKKMTEAYSPFTSWQDIDPTKWYVIWQTGSVESGPYNSKEEAFARVNKSIHRVDLSARSGISVLKITQQYANGDEYWAIDDKIRAATGVKEEFTGYWKGTDKGTPGKKMVGSASESMGNDETNPTDKIQMDVPLFIRALEYAKEDAKDDMDLHDLTERAIQLMQQNDCLSMDQYNDLVGGQQVDEGDESDDIDKQIDFHNQGLANANYKGVAATHHRKVLRKLMAKKKENKAD